MSDGMVRKWVRKFSESRDDNIYDEPRSDRSAVFTDCHILRGGDTELVHRYDKWLNNGGNCREVI